MNKSIYDKKHYLREKRILEQAFPIREFTSKIESVAYSLMNHCSYLLLYDYGRDDEHWKNEIVSFVLPLKKEKPVSGDKMKMLKLWLVDGPFGKNFSEQKEDCDAHFKEIYDSEEVKHDFNFDMTDPSNVRVYFDAMCSFYYKFLIPWISITDKNPDKSKVLIAIEDMLINRRKDMK